MFKQVTIIGFGLIGSSLARAIAEKGLAANGVVCGDKSKDVCKKVMELGLAEFATTDLAESVRGSDLVILSVPVGAMGDVAEEISSALKQGAIVSDVGSVKKDVITSVAPHIPEGVHFIPAHPIAGTEFSGPESGFAELFKGRWCILTPLGESDLRAVEKVTALWEACDSMIEVMDPKHHDLVLGITSHLPHLIAYTIVGTAADLEEDIMSEVIKFSASGFRDFTRIASSDPIMWRDVFLNNKEAVLDVLQRFTEDLTALQKAIRKGDGECLRQAFARTRELRKAIIDAQQADYAYPSESLAHVPPAVRQPSKDDQKG